MPDEVTLDHLDQAHAHLTKAYTRLHDATSETASTGQQELFTLVKAAYDATEKAWKAAGQARRRAHSSTF